MKKCHSDHMKVYANGHIKVTVSIPNGESEAFIGMAGILTDGCLATLIRDTSRAKIKELLEDAGIQRDLETAKNA